MKLVDGHGHVVAIGEIGEVYARSVYRFIEYKNMHDKFLDTVDEANWIRTGDLAYMRTDGNLVMIGRKNDYISVGSVKIFPQDLEQILNTCPEIDAVIVVPVPDKRLYQAICVCVIFSATVSIDTSDLHKLFDHLWADKSHLKPKYYLAFKEFPKNSSGKIDRKEIAREASLKLNL
jgi:fatty-acyl-CoA synthase